MVAIGMARGGRYDRGKRDWDRAGEGDAMRARYLRPLQAVAVAVMLLIASAGLTALAQNGTPTGQNPDPWPRQVHIDGATMTVYQPQVDSWDGGFLKLRAAVALKPDGSK